MYITKIKKYFIKNKVVIISQVVITLILLVALLGGTFLYAKKHISELSNVLIDNYVAVSASQDNTDVSGQKDNTEPENRVLPEVIQKAISHESNVVDLVENSNPAVVSIVVSKDVPKVEQYFSNPFGDLWGDNSFSIPQYKLKGTEKKEVGAGSGFIVSEDGLVVTNQHVVSDKDASYTLYTSNDKKYDVDVIARDTYLDIAVLKIKGGGKFPFLTFGDSDKIKLGQSVVAIGNALGEFRNSVSVGVVSGLSRSITAGDGKGNSELLEKVIQTDAAINPGNSGGPLLNMDGKVIGVNVAVAQDSQSVGFALPGNAVMNAVTSVKQYGEIARPYLGVRYLVVDKDLKQKNNIPVDYGVIVVKGDTSTEFAVIPSSPADKAGVLENDIILEVDGVRLEENKTLGSVIQEKKIGQVITLTIMRKGSVITLRATLEKGK